MEFTFTGTETQFKPDPETLDPDGKKYLPEFIALDTLDPPPSLPGTVYLVDFASFPYSTKAANSAKPLGKEEDSLLSLLFIPDTQGQSGHNFLRG